jgi:hypothetical protein
MEILSTQNYSEAPYPAESLAGVIPSKLLAIVTEHLSDNQDTAALPSSI